MTGIGNKKILICIILLFFGCYVRAKDSSENDLFLIDVWQTEDGLPQNSVISIAQTKDGYLWLGTLNGFARFDGLKFTVFDENNTPGLTSSKIINIFEDSKRNLWISTERDGVFLVRNGRFTNIDIGKGDRSTRVVSVCEDRRGSVWFYTADGQLCRYKNGRVDVWNYDADFYSACRTIVNNDTNGIIIGTDRRISFIDDAAQGDEKTLQLVKEVPTARLSYLVKSRGNGYWQISDGMIRKINGEKIEFESGETSWLNAQITCGVEMPDGRLVIGTLGAGLFIIDRNKGITTITTNNGLSHNYVLSVLCDREGSLWVGTDGGGLNRIRERVFRVIENTHGFTTQTVSEDANGGLWIGFNAIDPRSIGAIYFNSNTVMSFNITNGLINTSLRSIYVDKKGNVWAGSWGGLFRYRNGRFQRVFGPEQLNGVVQAIYEDKDGKLYFGTKTGLVSYDGQNWSVIGSKDGLSSDNIKAILQDFNGALWLGTEGGGVNLLTNGKIKVFRKKDNYLLSDNINSIFIDSRSNIWIASAGGLVQYKNGNWRHFSNTDGLVNNNISYIIEDSKANLWLGTSAGLARIGIDEINEYLQNRRKSIYVRNYNKSDGLPSGECSFGSQPSACKTRSGVMLFPTIKGLVSLDVDSLKINTNAPPVIIESVFIDENQVLTNFINIAQGNEVKVPPNRERIEILYTSLNLKYPERAAFKYKLEGFDNGWIDAGNTRVARYSKVPPGNYKFSVIACNEDGIWNESGASITFVIEPPFWRTWWFMSGSGVLIFICIAVVIHRISTRKLQRQLEALRQKEAIEKERSRIARDLHDQLGANLTQVALLGELIESEIGTPQEVEENAKQISKTARETIRMLDEIVWAVNPMNDTLESLISYISKFAYESLTLAGVKLRVDIPTQLPNLNIQPEMRHNLYLACKEAITNIIKHSKATEAYFRVRFFDNKIRIEIQDNGCGIKNVESTEDIDRSGLDNMRRRIRDIGGVINITSPEKGGTLITIELGFINN